MQFHYTMPVRAKGRYDIMKINATEKAILNDPVVTPIDKRLKPVRCLNNGYVKYADDWAKELGVTREAIYMVCTKKAKTCKGMRFRYDEDVAEVRDGLATELTNKDDENAKLKAELEAEREIANQWRAYQAKLKAEEEERLRAEREHLELIEHTRQAIENSKAEQERLKRVRETYENALQRVETDILKEERKEADLINKLLELEGNKKED